MRKRKTVREIEFALANIDKEVIAYAKRGRIAGGLALEGYKGGYRQALLDVLLLLSDTIPETRGWWRR